MIKYIAKIFISLTFFLSSAAYSFSTLEPGDHGACFSGNARNLSCFASRQGFDWFFVDSNGNTASIKVLDKNRVSLTVNGMPNGVWRGTLRGKSFYGTTFGGAVATDDRWSFMSFDLGLNGQIVQFDIKEFYHFAGFSSSGTDSSVTVTVNGWTYKYTVDAR